MIQKWHIDFNSVLSLVVFSNFCGSSDAHVMRISNSWKNN